MDGRQRSKRHVEDAEGLLGKRLKTEPDQYAIEDCAVMEINGDIQVLGTFVIENDISLRARVQGWLGQYSKLAPGNIKLCLGDLADLRSDSAQVWEEEVLHLREVQKRLLWAVRYARAAANQQERNDLVTLLKLILEPVEEIRSDLFPNLKEITASINTNRINSRPYKIRDIKQLPGLLVEKVEQLPDDNVNSGLLDIQTRLESTIKARTEQRDQVYENLVCVCVFQLFGFNVGGFFFQHQLMRMNLTNMAQMLDSHFKVFENMHSRVQRQAHLLNLGMCCAQSRKDSVMYIIRNMPEALCTEFSNTTTNQVDNVDVNKLHEAAWQVLNNNQMDLKLNLKSLSFDIKTQLHCLDRRTEPAKETAESTSSRGIRKKVKLLLQFLNMKMYYPQKLAYTDVIKLTSSVTSDVNRLPNDVTELPWYFMRHIIALDSDTREDCHTTTEDAGNCSDSDADNVSDAHPLDLMYAVFLCADDFLRQELTDKMVKCQYAVPFILPAADEHSNEQHLVLHWGLESVIRNFYQNDKVKNQTLVDVQAATLGFMTIGKETTWKEKIMNKMLSPQQETFWHKGLKGGDCSQMASHGIVDVAWYLPGRQANNKFQCPIAFLNIRNLQRDVIVDKLFSFCTQTCIFVVEITEELKIFLQSKGSAEKVVLIIVHSDDDKEIKMKTKELQIQCELQKQQIIRKAALDSNFNTVYEQLKRVIEQKIISNTQYPPLSEFIASVRVESEVKVDDKPCYFAQVAAESVLNDIDEFSRNKLGSAKGSILPCQSDVKLRQEIAALDKELCRQKKKKEEQTLEEYAIAVTQRKWSLQQSQLRIPISETFKYFLQCLSQFTSKEKRYFLQCLKLGLNKRSEQLLQPLYEEYERCRVENESEDKDKRLREINERLTHASVGIEHFFREMAVIYENMSALTEKLGPKHDLSRIMETMLRTVAELFQEGTAIEIMDGDAVHVPVTWLKSLLMHIENSSKSTLCKVSVLGAQSCGKSTLLNTMFGLNFPVSSGRCTRGAYLQLVKVDESMRKSIRSDYVAILDSEGLMSRTKIDDTDYDNELSTFIIGLSDLTLVIIKGEGNEMNDVLPLAIHVFLRMNVVGEHQACHFVHQNMGAVDAMTKVSTEIDAFVRDLNEKTLAASKDADQSDRYKKFTDVLHYNPQTDNTYVPGLWNGTPPMGKTNSQYSRTVQKLKCDVIESITSSRAYKLKRHCTFTELGKRFDVIWDAIKYENFVLSFKNVLAVEAHKKLTKVFDELQWRLKRSVHELIHQEKCAIENEMLGGPSSMDLRESIEKSQGRIQDVISEEVGDIKEKIEHYFKCTGCDGCDTSVTNRNLLVNNHKEFMDEVGNLRRSVIKELETSMEKLDIEMTSNRHLQEISIQMDAMIKVKVQEAVRSGNSKDLTRGSINDMFEELWSNVTKNILRSVRNAVRDDATSIQATVQQTIRSLLYPDDQHYVKAQSRSPGKYSSMDNTGNVVFVVNQEEHVRLIQHRWDDYMEIPITRADVRRLQERSDQIIRDSKHYYTCESPEGKQFHQRDVAELFLDVIKQIDSISDERFKIHFVYKADLLVYIQKAAMKGFIDMNNRYSSLRSPRALLEKKKRSYHDLFVLSMGQDDKALNFCENFLKAMILRNITEQLSCAELLHDLRVNCGNMFRDIRSLQAAIMVDLMKKNRFSYYLEYIVDYKGCVKRKIEMESHEHFINKKRIRILAKTLSDRICKSVISAMLNTLSSPCSNMNFIKTFLTKLDHLKISHSEASAYLELNVCDRKKFAKTVEEQLQGPTKNAINTKINNWKVKSMLKQKKLTEFLFKELVGCSATCPFCKVPCDAHSGGKTLGKHSATLHRPGGLGSYRWSNTNKLMLGDCRSYVASGFEFVHPDDEDKSTLYKDFHQVFPEWTIRGDADPDGEKYWKWVFAEYNEQLAGYWVALEAEVPMEWGRYDKQDIVKDIEDHYNCKVDVSKLRL